MPIRSERGSERRIGNDDDGEFGRKGLIVPEIQKDFGDLIRESFRFLGAGMVIRYLNINERT